MKKFAAKLSAFQQKVYTVVKQIPPGQVLTYQQVAIKLGQPQAARAVGNALNKNPFRTVPCHRVIRSDGRIGGFNRGTPRKAALLKQEGYW